MGGLPVFVGGGLRGGLGSGQLHATEILRFWLSGSHIEEPTAGAAGWFSERFGFFRKQIEALTLTDFILKLGDLFAALELKNVGFVEVDRHTVYSDQGFTNQKTHDLGVAINEVQSFLSSGSHQHNHLIFSALGEGQGMHLIVMAQYSHRHPSNEAPFETKITGIPSRAMLKENESEDQYWLRMARLSEADPNLGSLMGALSDHYVSETAKWFDVERSEKAAVSMGW